ncbi:MAG: DUF4339 domain-containing protein [Planctomycetia bacterium]|nr:DUF4339 domain-containing protein [Planctomycetia bacterium]
MKYYCMIGEHVSGPFSQEEINELIRRGELSGESILRTQRGDAPIKNHPEFQMFLKLQNPPPRLPQNPQGKDYVPERKWEPPAFLSFIRWYALLYPLLTIISWAAMMEIVDNACLNTRSFEKSAVLPFVVDLIFCVWVCRGGAQISRRPRGGLCSVGWGLFLYMIIGTVLGMQEGSFTNTVSLALNSTDEGVALLVFGLLSGILELIIVLYALFVSHSFPEKVE